MKALESTRTTEMWKADPLAASRQEYVERPVNRQPDFHPKDSQNLGKHTCKSFMEFC